MVSVHRGHRGGCACDRALGVRADPKKLQGIRGVPVQWGGGRLGHATHSPPPRHLEPQGPCCGGLGGAALPILPRPLLTRGPAMVGGSRGGCGPDLLPGLFAITVSSMHTLRPQPLDAIRSSAPLEDPPPRLASPTLRRPARAPNLGQQRWELPGPPSFPPSPARRAASTWSRPPGSLALLATRLGVIGARALREGAGRTEARKA